MVFRNPEPLEKKAGLPPTGRELFSDASMASMLVPRASRRDLRQSLID
jgi:hypothetical protein